MTEFIPALCHYFWSVHNTSERKKVLSAFVCALCRRQAEQKFHSRRITRPLIKGSGGVRSSISVTRMWCVRSASVVSSVRYRKHFRKQNARSYRLNSMAFWNRAPIMCWQPTCLCSLLNQKALKIYCMSRNRDPQPVMGRLVSFPSTGSLVAIPESQVVEAPLSMAY